ncbi:NirD/YgiW/YdeI family stress tolerance protein [Escherichia coli]|nr:NirD/YgiW/YdeI family stress tolerance protein [Escherichia coli]
MMKKILLVAAITGMFVQGVWAKSDQQIRDEAKNNVITVSQVSDMTEGSGVTLNGQIVKQLAAEEDHFELSDASGSIVIDVDDEVWRPLALKAGDKVQVVGEVDISDEGNRKATVDVLTLERLR